MNKQLAYCCLVLLMSPCAMYGEPINIAGNYWECTTQDVTNTHWSAQSSYEKVALNLSYAQCKKKSTSPATCKTSKNSCAQYIQGVNVMPMWRCTALDKEALSWRSTLYSNREDAALAAEAFCKQHSPVPDTCYINLITCMNMNRI